MKLTAGRVKSQRGVVGIADVMTSLFLKPTACRSPETRIARALEQPALVALLVASQYVLPGYNDRRVWV